MILQQRYGAAKSKGIVLKEFFKMMIRNNRIKNPRGVAGRRALWFGGASKNAILKSWIRAICLVLLNGWQVNRPATECEQPFFNEAAGFKNSHAVG